MADHLQQPVPAIGSRRLKDYANIVSDVLFYSIGEGAILIDERGNISRVNKIAEEILGFTANEIIGKWYPTTIVAEGQDGQLIPNIERPMTEVFFTGKPVFKKMYFRRKNGLTVPVALTVSPVMLKDKPIGAIEIFRDITDEMQLERAKDEFISIASHQLRTPATVVKQYLGMILDGFVATEAEQMDMIKIAYEHNDNELDIINDLLKVAQIEASKLKTNFTKMDVVPLLQSIVSSQEPEFEKREIGLQLKLAKKRVDVCMDPLHFQMVLENLISNANKYSNPGSKVTIEVLESGKHSVVKVTDQGIGIAKDDIPKLFNKFSRVENPNSSAGGTGLGLYWAKKLVEMYDGCIKVESKLNVGSSFSVTLPKERYI